MPHLVIYPSIHPSIDIRLVFTFELLWIMLLWTWATNICFGSWLSLFVHIYPKVELARAVSVGSGRVKWQMWTFWGLLWNFSRCSGQQQPGDSPRRKLTDERCEPVAPSFPSPGTSTAPAPHGSFGPSSCLCNARRTLLFSLLWLPCPSPKPSRATPRPPELPFLPGGYLTGYNLRGYHQTLPAFLCITEHQKPFLKTALLYRVPRSIFPLLSYL